MHVILCLAMLTAAHHIAVAERLDKGTPETPSESGPVSNSEASAKNGTGPTESTDGRSGK